MTCVLCRNSSSFLLAGDKREYRYCPNCTLIFVPGKFILPGDEERARYLEHNNSLENPGYVSMFMEKIRRVQEICPEVQTALDVGSGPEPVLRTLMNREGIATEIYDPFFAPQFPSGRTFDLVISTETFEHFSDPGRELDRLCPLIRPAGGYLAVMTRFYPTTAEGLLSEDEFATWYYKRDPTHIAFYAPSTFRWIARHYGMSIVYIDEKDFVIFQKS